MSTANPYAPPTNDEHAPIGDLPPEYRPSEGIATALRIVLALTTVSLLVSVVLTYLQLDLLMRMRDGGAWSMPEVEANDERVTAAAATYVLLFIVSAILWAVWQNRTNKNARALGADMMEFGPNAWGWFACPLANLWKPLNAVRELWICSDPRNIETMTPPSMFGLWWATWIIGSILGQISWRIVANDPEDIDVLINSSWADIGSGLALMVAGVAAIMVITAIQGRVASALARKR